MKDWSGAAVEFAKNEARAEQQVEALDMAFDQFLQQESDKDQVAKKARKVANQEVLDNQYVPNKSMALAIDNALHSVKLSLKYFAPARRPRALRSMEERFYIEVPDEHRISGSSARRACVRNVQTGESWVEIPRSCKDGSLHRPALHKALDQGSKGLPLCQYIDMGLGLRGSSTEDPWHRFHNDHRLALVDSDCWVLVCERMVVYNCTSAPWSSHGFFVQVREAKDEYFKLRSHRCPVFRMLYQDSHS